MISLAAHRRARACGWLGLGDTPLSGHVAAALLRFPVPQPRPATASGAEGGG